MMKMQITRVIIGALLIFVPLFTIGQENPREFEMKEGDTTYVMKKYIMCFLKSGPKRSQNEEEAQRIQKGHLAHMDSLAQLGIISIAGPFEDSGDVRGIVIYDLGTVEEARKMTAGDPAVVNGRLVPEFHPWWAAKGSVLP